MNNEKGLLQMSEEESLNLIIKISKHKVESVICEALDKDTEFVKRITDFIQSELSRDAFAEGKITRREWQRVDLSSTKIINTFCMLLRSDNELTKKLKKLVQKIVKEKDTL